MVKITITKRGLEVRFKITIKLEKDLVRLINKLIII